VDINVGDHKMHSLGYHNTFICVATNIYIWTVSLYNIAANSSIIMIFVIDTITITLRELEHDIALPYNYST
jgi:hypothetical protein